MALTKRKKVAFSIIMVTMTIVVIYFIAEFAVGRFLYAGAYKDSRMDPDSILGWRPQLGAYWLKPPSSYRKHLISVNTLGLRNRELTAKAAGTTRIVILGDSFAFGEICPEQEIFPVVVESLLNQGHPRSHFEVINASCPAYGTAQELLLMKKLTANGVIGDIYVLAAFPNDILDNAGVQHETLERNPRQPVFALDGSGNLVLKYLPPYAALKQAAALAKTGKHRPPQRRSMIAEAVRSRIETFVQTRPILLRMLAKAGITVKSPRMPGTISGWYEENIISDGVPLMKALIKEIRDEARSNGAELLVILIPSAFQVYFESYAPLLEKTFPDSEIVTAWVNDPNRPQRVTGEICAELGIPFLDLLPGMREKRAKAEFVAREGHLNKFGNRVVAESLKDFILQHSER